MMPHLRLIKLEPDIDLSAVVLAFDDNFHYTNICTHYDYTAVLATAGASENDLTVIVNWGNEDNDASIDESKITNQRIFNEHIDDCHIEIHSTPEILVNVLANTCE
jgi:hypothetical protein